MSRLTRIKEALLGLPDPERIRKVKLQEAHRTTARGCSMKQFIAAGLLALSFAAPAADVAHMPNQNGGLIALTDEPCRNYELPEASRRSAFHAYATGYSGVPMYGCYTVLSHSINVLWHEPISAHRVYPADAFVTTGRRANRNQGSNL